MCIDGKKYTLKGGKMKGPNIFDYATGELSQDAFKGISCIDFFVFCLF